MKTVFHRIIQSIKDRRKAKEDKIRRERIERCIAQSDIKYEHLIPIPDEVSLSSPQKIGICQAEKYVPVFQLETSTPGAKLLTA